MNPAIPEDMTMRCQGCDDHRPTEAYVVTYHDGVTETVRYCEDCAALATTNGEIVACEACGADLTTGPAVHECGDPEPAGEPAVATYEEEVPW